jgi:hypothetical protein
MQKQLKQKIQNSSHNLNTRSRELKEKAKKQTEFHFTIQLSFHYLPVVLSTAKTWGDHANYCQIMAS